MTRARQLQKTRSAAALAAKATTTLRQRRPKTKDSLAKEKRIRQLDEAIVTGDIEKLRKLSVTGAGFVNHAIRRRAWPLLLRTHVPRKHLGLDSATEHKDEEQVRLDIVRSFTHLPMETSEFFEEG
ncbi:hypothetical protein BX616_010377 [Lobosporangium transversale]|nr:hypothetical protein BX616_010377 [Lobosporangium transversale]